MKRANKVVKAFTVLLGTAMLFGCGQYGKDYCATEKRHIPDREKMLRYMMVQYTGELSGHYVWEQYNRKAPHFSQWMAREAPNRGERQRVQAALNRYLDDHPNFIQIVGREPFVRNYDGDSYLRKAVKAGYYADIVVMGGKGSKYPIFREDGKYGGGYFDTRDGMTNCGQFINWQLVGG